MEIQQIMEITYWFITSFIAVVVSYIGWLLKCHVREVKLMRIDIISMDYALSLESTNGYNKSRDEKKKKLLTDHNFKYKD